MTLCYICGNGTHNECALKDECDCECRATLKSDACALGDHNDCWGEPCTCDCHGERLAAVT